MDLLATVRKEGSRGGTGDFKWSDVQASSRRENYLGHSLMAPVGRWQKNRDLNWYAKADDNPNGEDEDEAARAARERKEELRRVKEAEEDAMARALGFPVPDRNNPNLQALGDKEEVDKALQTIDKDGLDADGHGVGFGKGHYDKAAPGATSERIEGNAEAEDKELRDALKEYKRRHTDDHRHRRRSRSRDRDRRHRRRDRSEEHRHRHSSRDGQRRHRRREYSRSRSPARPRYDEYDRKRRHDRSRSPSWRTDRRQDSARKGR